MITKDALEAECGCYALIRAVGPSANMVRANDEEVRNYFRGCELVAFLSELYGLDLDIDEDFSEFYARHKDDFTEVCNAMADELSRNSIGAFIKARVEKNRSYLFPFWNGSDSYFFPLYPWYVRDDEVLVDGGAFDGDTIRDFLPLTGGRYKKIYAVEPDPCNMKLFQQFLTSSGIRNIETVMVGLYSCKDTIRFSVTSDMGTHIASDGEESLEVDAIDNICRDLPPTIIKMDIEGAELEALRGAERTLREYSPMLYISAYHKRGDLIELYRYIKSVRPDYKFFFRLHKPLAADAVLYGIPPERVKY